MYKNNHVQQLNLQLHNYTNTYAVMLKIKISKNTNKTMSPTGCFTVRLFRKEGVTVNLNIKLKQTINFDDIRTSGKLTNGRGSYLFFTIQTGSQQNTYYTEMVYLR